jgi:hypothetical protein
VGGSGERAGAYVRVVEINECGEDCVRECDYLGSVLWEWEVEDAQSAGMTQPPRPLE